MKVVKFHDYITNEDTYKVNDEGKVEKQEWEMYKDWHPSKFKVFNLTKKSDTVPFENGEYVWVIKRNDVIVGVFSSMIEEVKIEEFFNNLKDNSVDLVNNNKGNEITD